MLTLTTTESFPRATDGPQTAGHPRTDGNRFRRRDSRIANAAPEATPMSPDKAFPNAHPSGRPIPESATPDDRASLVKGAGPELLDDGQEEVFAHTAVERGDVEDPKALGPEDLARAPRSPGSLAAPRRKA